MTVEEAVCERVLSLGAVAAIASSRVYLMKLPQSPVYPAVRVQLVDDPLRYHLRGPHGTKVARVQVDAYSNEDADEDPYVQVASLADAIDGDGLGPNATGLSGWIGSVGSPALEVSGCFRVDRTQRYDPEEIRVLTMSQDYMIWWRQT